MNDQATSAVLSCRALSKSYRQGGHLLQVLDGLELDVPAGERLAIIGSSGSGKTTLLNLLGGIDTPDSGRVIVNGRDLQSLGSKDLDRVRNASLGFVYQFHHLLGEFSAVENVAMPLLIGGKRYRDALASAGALLDRVGLAERHEHRPAQLSGGERQRVAIARALVNEPACVLMDEPTGNLDRHTADSVQQLMIELNRELRTSFVTVTHDLALAGRMDRILKLDSGRLVEDRGE